MASNLVNGLLQLGHPAVLEPRFAARLHWAHLLRVGSAFGPPPGFCLFGPGRLPTRIYGPNQNYLQKCSGHEVRLGPLRPRPVGPLPRPFQLSQDVKP